MNRGPESDHESQITTHTMVIEWLYLSLRIEVDKDGIALVVAACDVLSKGSATHQGAWSKRKFAINLRRTL